MRLADWNELGTLRRSGRWGARRGRLRSRAVATRGRSLTPPICARAAVGAACRGSGPGRASKQPAPPGPVWLPRTNSGPSAARIWWPPLSGKREAIRRRARWLLRHERSSPPRWAAGCCCSSDPQACPTSSTTLCFDSLRRLLVAASLRVEQANEGLGHGCRIAPDAEASCWLPRGRLSGSQGWRGSVRARPSFAPGLCRCRVASMAGC